MELYAALSEGSSIVLRKPYVTVKIARRVRRERTLTSLALAVVSGDAQNQDDKPPAKAAQSTQYLAPLAK